MRFTHIPTGLVVSCQTERSQHQNREHAMRLLTARLTRHHETQQALALAEFRGDQAPAEWVNQIRSYFPHPRKLVKDHRTEHQARNIDVMLQGDIGPFIQAKLLQAAGTPR